jgi:hypothetical protein
MEDLPYACMIFVDPVGQWDIAEFEIAWFNKAAKELLGSHISGGRVHTSTDEKLKTFTENLHRFRQDMIEERKTFIGPFTSIFINDSEQTIQYDWYAMYLGEIGLSRPTFLFLAQGQTLE